MGEGSIKVVCIEDQQDVIDLIKVILTPDKYNVLGVLGGNGAVTTVESFAPQIVLLDIMMPGIDGWEVYRQLRKNPKTSEIPVVAVTAKSQAIDRFMGSEIARFNGYITKPFSPNELLEGISKALQTP